MSITTTFRILLLCWLVALSGAAFGQNRLDSVRIWPSPNNTRVVLDLQDTPKFTYFRLRNPDRLVVDLPNTSKKFDIKSIKNDSNLINRIRESTPKNKKSVRLVFELDRRVKPQIFALAPTKPYGNRLVIDLGPDGVAAEADPIPKVVKDTQSGNTNRDIVIAIDAGHGGEDPGSIGYAGSYEKNVTLKIARLLEKKINAEPGMRAIQVRTGDYYVSLNRRPQIARSKKADLFVSIHADAYTTPQPNGASVWVLSMSRANSELGRWIEQREKHSELLGGAAEIIQNTANERYLTQALLDMSMDHSLATSYEVSRDIIGKLKGVTKMHKKRPQSASLAVLTSPDIPSILVETGFISNPKEEKNLNSSKHRRRLANAIFAGIRSHFRQSPPDGTLWANQRANNRTHKVRRGESLSLLAQRYNVRLSHLKEINNLSSDVVQIGQVLTIPSS